MKECSHCGGPNAPENRICDYCGMGFGEETIPEGSIDPREQAKIDEMIEDAGKPVEPWKYEGSALEAFDKFYESLDN